jgi:hypothetical protein
MGWADMAAATAIGERAAAAAILSDSEDAWAHYALGCVYLFTRQFDASLTEFDVALRLSPNFSRLGGITAYRCPIVGDGKTPMLRRHERCG